MNKALVLAATLVSAAAVAAAAEPAPTSVDAKSEAKEKQICRNISEVGSRLNRRRVCATKAQWDELEQQNRLAIDRVQNGRQTAGN